MRWKLVVIVSFVAALVAFSLWEIAIAFIFGGVRPIQPHPRLLFGSTLIPVGFSCAAGLFVYRHTSRRRKTQAILSVFLTLIVTVSIYFAGSRLFPGRLRFPQPCNYPCE